MHEYLFVGVVVVRKQNAKPTFFISMNSDQATSYSGGGGYVDVQTVLTGGAQNAL